MGSSMAKPNGICAIEGCGKKLHQAGFCAHHYHRKHKYGDPLGRPASYLPPPPVGYRRCGMCKEIKPLTLEFFYRKGSNGEMLNRCIECWRVYRQRRAPSDNAKRREITLAETAEQRAARLDRRREQRAAGRYRAIELRSRYNATDMCDLTLDEIRAEIEKPCTYCGTRTAPRGLDRIDNQLPHTRGNVLPACVACNLARGNRFSVEEMKIIGKAIAEVRAARPSDYVEVKMGRRSERRYRRDGK